MVQKSKGVVAKGGVGKLFGRKRKAEEAVANEKQEEPEVEETEEADEEMEEEEPQLTEKQLAAKRKQQEKDEEKEAASKREKELKAMYVDDLKTLAESLGLTVGKRDEMMKAVLKHEAKERAEAREKETQIRDVVVEKKAEFEAVSAPELKKLCAVAKIIGNLTKAERIEKLLANWLHEDGVSKMLQDKARQKKEAELAAMDKPTLRKLCDKAGIDPFLKDVLIDRLVRHETAAGKFLKPTGSAAPVQEEPKITKKTANMVEALLAKERESEEAAKKEVAEAEAVAKRIKEFKAKSIDELKKLLKRKGLENASAKKEDLVRVLYEATVEEEALVTRKASLKSMDKDALIKLLSPLGLDKSGGKEKMVEALLAHEEALRKELKAFRARLVEAANNMKAELAKQSGGELKETCAKKGLAIGGTNEDKISRLVDAAEKDGELDSIVVKMNRDARRNELSGMEKIELVKLCDSLEVDALVKEVLVERLLTHEAESGEPVAKKPRK